MYLVREVLNCRPGKVGEMIRRFKALSAVLKRMGYKPFRLSSDVSGERFWTLVAETESESLDAFFEMEKKVIARTKLLGPGESETITFTAPKISSQYDFLCTFPGHFAAGMKGKMIVQ